MLLPERIVLGGGVLGTEGLIPRVRSAAAILANGYFGIDRDGYDKLVQAPGVGERAGLLSALALAMDLAR